MNLSKIQVVCVKAYLVENPEDMFSRNDAHMALVTRDMIECAKLSKISSDSFVRLDIEQTIRFLGVQRKGRNTIGLSGKLFRFCEIYLLLLFLCVT